MLFFILIHYFSTFSCTKEENEIDIFENIDVPLKFMICVRGLRRIPIKVCFKAYEKYKLLKNFKPRFSSSKTMVLKKNIQLPTFPEKTLFTVLSDYFYITIDKKILKVDYLIIRDKYFNHIVRFIIIGCEFI